MGAGPSGGPQGGGGRSEQGRDVEPARAARAGPENDEDTDAGGTTEIPLGMPGDPRDLAQLKRRAEEPDPIAFDEDAQDDI